MQVCLRDRGGLSIVGCVGVDDDLHERVVRDEFSRTAAAFADRHRHRYDALDAVSFSGLARGGRVLEVGAGAGAFLGGFRQVASLAIALDFTKPMLEVARHDHPWVRCVLARGTELPFPARSFELVACANALHHMPDPGSVLREMARTTRGRVLVVDQAASETRTEAEAQNQLERLRDPSHVTARSPSSQRRLLESAGLEVVGERVVEHEETVSAWTSSREFPPSRIEAVRQFLSRHASSTGMEFRKLGDDWAFRRRTVVLLAERL